MRTRLIFVAFVACVASAQTVMAKPLAYVDEVSTFGDASVDRAQDFVVRVLRAGGYDVRLRDAGTAACGEDAHCLTERARSAGAAIAARAAVLGLAGAVSVTFVILDVELNKAAVFTTANVDLATTDETLVGLVTRPAAATVTSKAGERDAPLYEKWWFWTAVGGIALGAAGTAYYYSGTTTYVPPSGSLGGFDRR